jgi:DNA-binding beta-propeller fold protein YncE
VVVHHRALIGLALAACAGPDPGETPDTDPATATELWVEAGEPLVVEVGAVLRLTGTGSPGTAVWDLGDGTSVEGYAVDHVYQTPGNRVAILQVTDAEGRRKTDFVRVTAHLPLANPRPTASSPLALHEGVAWVAVPEAGHVAAIDLSTGLASYVPACAGPRTVAVHGAFLAVACEEADAVALIDRSTRTRTALLPLGAGARPYAVLSRGDDLLVTAQGTGDLREIRAEGLADPPTPLGTDPRALALDADGGAWVSRFRAVQDHGAVYGPAGEVRLAKDPGPDSDTANRGVPTNLHALALSPDGGRLYIGATLANVDRGLWVEQDGEPSLLSFESSVRATLRVVDTMTATERFTDRRQYDNQGVITALALSPLGNWLWLAHQGTHTLTRVDAYTLGATGAILDAGAGIDALAVTEDGQTLIVHAWLDRELRAYDISDPSVPSPPLRWTTPTVATEPLNPEALVGKRLFHDARDTRLALHGYLSCSACHPDGRDDGLTWDFTQRGEGLRNTISLVGHGGTAMGPVHWTGNFDEIQDFENDVRNAQGGAGLLSEADWLATSDPLGPPKAGRSADLDALDAYVSSLRTTPPSPHPEPEGGAALFEAAGCATCHDPARHYTDSRLDAAVRHDVGTLTAASGQRRAGPLDGLDTPTLLGAWATAPYLHDGSAATLEQAIAAHGGAEVAGPALDEPQLALLADYVRSLPQQPYEITASPPE